MPHSSIQDTISHRCQLWQIGLYHLRWKPGGERGRSRWGRGMQGGREGGRGWLERGRRAILPLCWLIWFNPCGAAIEFPSKPFPFKRIWTQGSRAGHRATVWVGDRPVMARLEWWEGERVQGKKGGLENCRKINKNLEEEKEKKKKKARSMRMSPLSRGKLYQFCRDKAPGCLETRKVNERGARTLELSDGRDERERGQ